jgi:hypothetical protein
MKAIVVTDEAAGTAGMTAAMSSLPPIRRVDRVTAHGISCETQERPPIASRVDVAAAKQPPLLDRHVRGDGAFDDIHCILAA